MSDNLGEFSRKFGLGLGPSTPPPPPKKNPQHCILRMIYYKAFCGVGCREKSKIHTLKLFDLRIDHGIDSVK